MELITDLRAIHKEIGLRLEESSLYPKLNLDAYKDVTPILVKKGKGDYTLLVKEVETGNFTPGGSGEPVLRRKKVRPIYYSSYFTWDKLARKKREFPPDEAAALEKAFRRKSFSIHADMALDRFRRLSQKFDLTFASPPEFPGKIWIYEINSRTAEDRFLRKRKAVNRWAWDAVQKRLAMSPDDRRVVKKYLDRPPFRAFKVLNELMSSAGLSCLLASSPINIQEMTGIPFDRAREGLLSLYCKGKIYLLSRRPVAGLKKGSLYPSLREALESSADKLPIGVEEKNLDIGRCLALGLTRLKNASNLFRAWREVRSGQDLGSYILASLGTRYAMEGALETAAAKLKTGKPVFEKDVEKAFYRLLKDYEKKERTPLRLDPYFMVLHAGSRTPYPSLPGIFRLSGKMNSLKLDAGIVVKDDGLILACSDLARSVCTNQKAEDLYRVLEKAMLEGAIPGGKEGQTGEGVYWAGVRPLLRAEGTLRAWKIIPDGGSLKKDYNRDIGHTFGKQESTTMFFKKGETSQVLKQGMVSAIEYQWPYEGYALGIEDMFVVGPKYGINITR